MSIQLLKMGQSLKHGNSNAVARSRLCLHLNHLASSYRSISSVSVGSKYTSSFKNFATDGNGKVLSYFHDIPINLNVAARTATMVVEVPRWSNAKFEISTQEAGNPIVQDVKEGQVRFVKNLFPYHGYIHNYGAFPQTWEDPTKVSSIEGLLGDGDPLDVCEIGTEILETGKSLTVKILGSLALVDDGELDWKVIVINSQDPLANHLSDIQDVFKECPGLLEATIKWFRDYKRPDGKQENKFALSGQYRGLKETVQTIQECHEAWKTLVSGKIQLDKFAIDNVTLKETPRYVPQFSFNNEVIDSKPLPEAPIPLDISKNYYFE